MNIHFCFIPVRQAFLSDTFQLIQSSLLFWDCCICQLNSDTHTNVAELAGLNLQYSIEKPHTTSSETHAHIKKVAQESQFYPILSLHLSIASFSLSLALIS